MKIAQTYRAAKAAALEQSATIISLCDQICADSPATRRAQLGRLFLLAGAAIKSAAPTIVAGGLLLGQTIAQSGPSGPILGGSAEGLGRTLRAVVYLMAGVFFFFGIIFIGLGVFEAAQRQQGWHMRLIWGGALMAFGVIAAVIYQLARGQQVQLDYDVSAGY